MLLGKELIIKALSTAAAAGTVTSVILIFREEISGFIRGEFEEKSSEDDKKVTWEIVDGEGKQ